MKPTRASWFDDETGGDGDAGRAGKLERVLTTFDLTSLGVGSCIGTGMYVVAGLVAKNVAGPSTVLSFCIAAFASILSGESRLLASHFRGHYQSCDVIFESFRASVWAQQCGSLKQIFCFLIHAMKALNQR